MMQPPDGASPNPEAEEYLRRLARESADQVLKGYQAFLISDIAPELKRAVVEEVRSLIPSRDGLVKEAADALNAKADAGLGEIRGRIGQIEDVLKKLVGGTLSPASVAQGGPTLQGELSLPGMGGKGVNLGQIGNVIDYALDKFIKVQELRIMQDPIALALKIKAADPIRSAIVGQILNPDPTGQFIGAALAKVGTDLYGKGFSQGITIGRTQQGDGGGPSKQSDNPAIPLDGSRAWYGGPSLNPSNPQTNPHPQNSAQPQGNAMMTNSGNEPGPQANGPATVRVSERARNGRAAFSGNFK